MTTRTEKPPVLILRIRGLFVYRNDAATASRRSLSTRVISSCSSLSEWQFSSGLGRAHHVTPGVVEFGTNHTCHPSLVSMSSCLRLSYQPQS